MLAKESGPNVAIVLTIIPRAAPPLNGRISAVGKHQQTGFHYQKAQRNVSCRLLLHQMCRWYAADLRQPVSQVYKVLSLWRYQIHFLAPSTKIEKISIFL